MNFSTLFHNFLVAVQIDSIDVQRVDFGLLDRFGGTVRDCWY
jgi:hypothetical protein